MAGVPIIIDSPSTLVESPMKEEGAIEGNIE